MKKYRVLATMTTGFEAYIEAKDEDEAWNIVGEDEEEIVWVPLKRHGEWYVDRIEELKYEN